MTVKTLEQGMRWMHWKANYPHKEKGPRSPFSFNLGLFWTQDPLEAPLYWWRWRELNPRPQILRLRFYMLIRVFGFNCLLPDWQGRQTAIP